MKIKLLDEILKDENLDLRKSYDVIRKETQRDDLYYIVQNELNEEVVIHELLCVEV